MISIPAMLRRGTFSAAIGRLRASASNLTLVAYNGEKDTGWSECKFLVDFPYYYELGVRPGDTVYDMTGRHQFKIPEGSELDAAGWRRAGGDPIKVPASPDFALSVPTFLDVIHNPDGLTVANNEELFSCWDGTSDSAFYMRQSINNGYAYRISSGLANPASGSAEPMYRNRGADNFYHFSVQHIDKQRVFLSGTTYQVYETAAPYRAGLVDLEMGSPGTYRLARIGRGGVGLPSHPGYDAGGPGAVPEIANAETVSGLAFNPFTGVWVEVDETRRNDSLSVAADDGETPIPNVLLNDRGENLTVAAVAGGSVGSPVSGSAGGEFVLYEDGSGTFDPKSDFATLLLGATTTTSATYTNSAGTSATLTVTISGVAAYEMRLQPENGGSLGGDPTGSLNDGTTVNLALGATAYTNGAVTRIGGVSGTAALVIAAGSSIDYEYAQNPQATDFAAVLSIAPTDCTAATVAHGSVDVSVQLSSGTATVTITEGVSSWSASCSYDVNARIVTIGYRVRNGELGVASGTDTGEETVALTGYTAPHLGSATLSLGGAEEVTYYAGAVVISPDLTDTALLDLIGQQMAAIYGGELGAAVAPSGGVWLDAAKAPLGSIATLVDQSGNGWDATQAVAGYRPTVSRDGALRRITFDGVDDWLDVNENTLATAGVLFVVFVPNGNNGNLIGSDPAQRYYVLDRDTGVSALLISGANATGEVPVTFGSPYVLVFRGNASTHTLHIDGVSDTIDTLSLAPPIVRLNIGSYNEGASSHFSGALQEFAQVRGAMTDAEINRIAADLAEKWGAAWTGV